LYTPDSWLDVACAADLTSGDYTCSQIALAQSGCFYTVETPSA
jgi:hypothetical protein